MESRRLVFTWIVIAVAVLSQGCGAPSDSESTKPKGYILSEKEGIVLNHLLKEELNISLAGGDTLLMKEIISTSAKEVATAYRENEVAADQAYFKKILLLSAKVHEINSGFGNEPVLSLFGVEMFNNPKAYFENPDLDRIAKISKGSQQKLVCIGNGIRLGIPVFNKCEFADVYFAKKIDHFREEIKSILSGGAQSSDLALKMAVASIVIARALPENSICFKEQNKCTGEINKIENSFSDDKFSVVTSELKSAGVRIKNQ